MPRKTIANCTMLEFLPQANKIRKKVALFYKDIIKPLKDLKPPFSNEDFKNEKDTELIAEMKKANENFTSEKLEQLFDTALETNAELTLEVLALCCFEDVDAFKKDVSGDVMCVFIDLFSSKRCVDFFTTLQKLTNSGNTSEK